MKKEVKSGSLWFIGSGFLAVFDRFSKSLSRRYSVWFIELFNVVGREKRGRASEKAQGNPCQKGAEKGPFLKR